MWIILPKIWSTIRERIVDTTKWKLFGGHCECVSVFHRIFWNKNKPFVVTQLKQLFLYIPIEIINLMRKPKCFSFSLFLYFLINYSLRSLLSLFLTQLFWLMRLLDKKFNPTLSCLFDINFFLLIFSWGIILQWLYIT